MDLIGGRVQVMFDVTVSSIEFIKAGKLRPLAVTTTMRLSELPPGTGDGRFCAWLRGERLDRYWRTQKHAC